MTHYKRLIRKGIGISDTAREQTHRNGEAIWISYPNFRTFDDDFFRSIDSCSVETTASILVKEHFWQKGFQAHEDVWYGRVRKGVTSE
ncbi:hypothetical protein DNHGIG_14220 [Collibacillus ludicampi]|uniref:Uncharacterized protein n=1 Tax=Collibacillus ludicampi TaxID=2771369 RepID=A0AAV4LDZ5_9BACL|nr:hypothetical protein DNHGIG_14220 [Collibacillus ludicampi]